MAMNSFERERTEKGSGAGAGSRGGLAGASSGS